MGAAVLAPFPRQAGRERREDSQGGRALPVKQKTICSSVLYNSSSILFLNTLDQFVLNANRTICSGYDVLKVSNMVFERIRELREDNDIKQYQISEAIGIRQRAYSYYETGKRTVPPEILLKLADYHNTSVDYLLGHTDEKTPYPPSTRCKE